MACASLAALACGAEPTPTVEARPGAPLPGLTDDETRRFGAGRALFDRPFDPAEGLGPLFNQTRCSSCHDLPTSGGHGAEPVTRVTRYDEVGGCSLLEDEGGDLLQASVTPAAREAGVRPEQIPPSANGVTEMGPPPLYGLGLVEAVAEEDIRSRADPADRDGDGISGRAGRAPDGSLGRFGGKGRHATLESFIVTAARGELGLTTPAHPGEELPNGRPLPDGVDPAPDPELDAARIALLVDYVRFLAPPERRLPEDTEQRAPIEEGERVFESLGCATCHVPTMTTGAHESEALDRTAFRIYSDLLLHDMGPELADICAPGVAPSEWVTARLVGLGLRTEFLHNRRAQGLEAAIRLHGGEARAARDAYEGLDPTSRERLMRFLRSL